MLLKWKSKKSFSLLEMMMVALVLTILVSISAAQYFKAAEKGRGAQATEVLTRIWRGYRVMIANEVLDPVTYSWSNRLLVNGTSWDPNIVGGDWDWQLLGFEENPNNDLGLKFGFGFFPRGWTQSEYASFLPHPHNLAIAIRRSSSGLDYTRYIYMDCDNGTIVKSTPY